MIKKRWNRFNKIIKIKWKILKHISICLFIGLYVFCTFIRGFNITMYLIGHGRKAEWGTTVPTYLAYKAMGAPLRRRNHTHTHLLSPILSVPSRYSFFRRWWCHITRTVSIRHQLASTMSNVLLGCFPTCQLIWAVRVATFDSVAPLS